MKGKNCTLKKKKKVFMSRSKLLANYRTACVGHQQQIITTKANVTQICIHHLFSFTELRYPVG